MPAPHRLIVCTLLAMAAATPQLNAAEPLTRQELGRLGKAATALVENPARGGFGSAFCIHPSGLFVTNEHVVRGGSAVTLVVDSGQPGQRSFRAAVIRADKDLDLALLRAEGVPAGTKLAALTLGNAEGLAELAELVAFGFPFGKDLAPKGEYPSISINVGSVTSLRRKGGELFRIQLDAALNPGNSGGPVLDKAGQVVGVVVSGVQGAGVNFAIPVNHVLRFALAPELGFEPPAVDRADAGKPAAFRATLMELLPADGPVGLELTLKVGDGPERRFPMEPAAGGEFRVSAPPVPPTAGPAMLRAVFTYEGGSVTGSVADSAFRIGGRELKLSEVRLLRLRPKPAATLGDGKTVEGEPAGLEALAVSLGNEQIRLNLARAVEARFEPPEMPASVSCTVVATRGGKEIARRTEVLAIRGGGPTAPAGTSGSTGTSGTATGPIAPPTLEAGKVVRQLPAPVADLAVGGGGRFLILHFPKLRKLGIFDVTQAKIVNYVAVADDSIRFTAGLDKLVVVLGSTNIIQRWSLTTFERELATTLPVKGTVRAAVMGSASAGPVLIGVTGESSGNFHFLDLTTLRPIEMKRSGFMNTHGDSQYFPNIRVSADGTVFGLWHTGLSPSGLNTMVLLGGEIKQHNAHVSVGHVAPGPDGKMVFTAAGLWTNEAKPVGRGENESRFCVPANAGSHYMVVRTGDRFGRDEDKTPGVSVHMLGDERPLINLTDIELKNLGERWGGGKDLAFDKRIHFIPAAKLIITVPQTNDQLVLHRFDIEEALEKSGIDYLLVTSQPPLSARKGDAFSYRVTAKAKKGGLKFRLESGPAGMTITPAGELRWAVPAGTAEKEVSVIVTVSDAAGQETFHTFSLALKD